jgi:hypothetical protein
LDNRDFDNMVKEALKRGTAIDPQVKEEIWINIENRLGKVDKGERFEMKKRRNRIISLAASIAAVAVLVLGLQTQPGLALVNRIRDMFVPEKNITQDIEGQTEEQDVQLNEGKDAEYVIYVDQERYVFERGQRSDMIVPNPPLEERYPEVSMEIKQVNDKSPEELIAETEAELKQEFDDVTVPKQVDSPVSGWMVRGLEGSKWDSRLVKVYVISNQKQGSFVITQRYFLEAEEGHGARFDHMLKEFHIIGGQA